ncbi:MAG TPA: nitroreductase [Saprospiraceae bacterium]|nr:nitroreductase [Saprospiraceae bacterium]
MNQKTGLEIELGDAIRNRRAVFPKMFNERVISQDVIDDLLELANWAPSHKRTEPWRFVVITGDSKEEVGQLAADAYKSYVEKFDEFKYKKTKRNFLRSSHVLAIVLHRDLKERVPEWEELAAVSMAVQNLWLGCLRNGVGGYWSTPKWRESLSDALQLKENEKCLGFFYLGHYDAPDPPAVRQNWKEKVRYFK